MFGNARHPWFTRTAPPSGWHATFSVLALGGAAIVLIVEPAIWLVNTWVDPSYDSSGFLVFAAAAGLFAWSVTSPVALTEPAPRAQAAIRLLVLSAVVRLASQLLAVNMIGAVCLALDVYAVGLLCRIDCRARPVSPTWLAVVFAFSLPVERVLQRSVGYLLQEVSADGACTILSMLYSDLVCRGVRLIVNGVDVLVDLPCSGARALLLGLLGYSIAAALCRPRPRQAVLGAAATLAAAGIANVLRISVLAAGLADPALVGGIDVMSRPWHDLIGLSALSIVCLVVIMWASACNSPAKPQSCKRVATRLTNASGLTHRTGLLASSGALVAALVIINLPRTPVDVSQVPDPVHLPLALDNRVGRSVELTAREEAYFRRFGGSAAKAEYGPMGLMVTRTTSPLRHLHAPDDCLRGLGFEVAYLGATFEPLPTAVYRAVAPDGRRYRVEVSFVSDRGDATFNVAAAVWLWMQGDARTWTAVQRIAPESLPREDQARFTRAVVAALDIAEPLGSAESKG